jgi:hypothetical protein
MQRARDRIRELTLRKRLRDPVEEVVKDINRYLCGWGGYFRYGHSALRFDRISNYAFKRLALFVAKRHQRKAGYGLSVVAYWSPDRGADQPQRNRRLTQGQQALAGQAGCRR